MFIAHSIAQRISDCYRKLASSGLHPCYNRGRRPRVPASDNQEARREFIAAR